MHLNIVANSAGYLLVGLAMILGGVAAALVLQDLRPLLLLLPGLALTVRIVKDAASAKLGQIARAGIPIKKVDKQFFGVFGSYFVVGPVEVSDLQAAERLAQAESEVAASPLNAPGGFGEILPIPLPPGLQVWSLASIDKVSFASDGNSITISHHGVESEHRFAYTHARDSVLKILKPAVRWEIDQQFRRIFRLNPIAAIACLLVMFFAIALVFTTIGLVQPNQMPLADWNDVDQAKGKAKSALTLWVLLCEAYLFLLRVLHPVVAFVAGTAAAVGLGGLLYTSQWTRASDTTWSQQRPK